MKWWHVVVVVLAATALALRFGDLGKFPPLLVDERLYAAEALSIQYTGHDLRETGSPLYLRGFSDDFDNRTSVLYLYLTTGLFYLFGPSLLLMRLPVALFGLATALLTADITRRLSGSRLAAAVAGLFLALTPIAIFTSRRGEEIGMLPFFQTLLVWLFLIARHRPRWYALAPIIVAVGFYSYQPLKLMGPALFLLLVAFEWRHVRQHWRTLLLGCVPAVLMAAPSIWLHVTRWTVIQREAAILSVFKHPLWPLRLLQNYGLHFWNWFWPTAGLVGPLVALAGIAWLRTHRRGGLALAWLLSAPIAGALTEQQSNPLSYQLRSGGVWPALAILVGFGALWLWRRRQRLGWQLALVGGSITIVVSMVFTTLVVYPTYQRDASAALVEAIKFVEQPAYRDREVVVTTAYDEGDFHGHTILFTVNDPALYRVPRTWGNAHHGYWDRDIQYLDHIGRYSVCRIGDCYERRDGRLYIIAPGELPGVEPIFVAGASQARWNQFIVVDNR